MKCPKSDVSLLNIDYINKEVDIYLSKEVMWVSLGQRATKLKVNKVGGLKKIRLLGSLHTMYMRAVGFDGPDDEITHKI